MSPEESSHVLVVEDHPPTARIVTTVLSDVDPSLAVDVVNDGSDCLAILRGEHDSIAVPDIVLLDIKLLDVDGLAVLKQCQEEEPIPETPFVVLSGENDSQTVVQCYERGANTFFSKPDDLDGYRGVAETIVDYWIGNAELPSDHAASV